MRQKGTMAEDSFQMHIYGEDRELSNTPLNVVPKAKPSIFPNQKCLSESCVKRIIYSLQKQRMQISHFTSVDFQVRQQRNTLEKRLKNALLSDLHG